MGAAAHLLLALAGFCGAGGVALAAVAAHKVDSPSLSTAAVLLVVHAAAVVGLVAISQSNALGRWWLGGAWILLFGALLFSASVAKLALQGTPLFPMSAPTGGTLMMVGWLVVALVALASLIQR